MIGPGVAAYRAGWATIAVTALLTVWTTVVRDDGSGIGYFMVVLAAGVGALGARFGAGGMARAMIGVAAMQLLLGLAVATAPVTAAVAGAAARAVLFNGVFAGLWLVAGALFRRAERRESE